MVASRNSTHETKQFTKTHCHFVLEVPTFTGEIGIIPPSIYISITIFSTSFASRINSRFGRNSRKLLVS